MKVKTYAKRLETKHVNKSKMKLVLRELKPILKTKVLAFYVGLGRSHNRDRKFNVLEYSFIL